MRVALLGYKGYWGERLGRVVGQLGHQIVHWIDSANEQELEDSDADVAIIATPPDTHYKLAMRAMRVGMDVLVEKPMAMKRSHALEMASFAHDHDIVLSVDSTFVHTATFDYLFERNEPIISFQSLRLAPPMPQAQINAGWDLICHDLAILQGLAIPLDSPASGVEDGSVAQAAVALPTGGSAFISASRAWPTKVREIVIHSPAQTYLWTLDGLFNLSNGGEPLVSETVEPLKRLIIDFDERCQTRQVRGKTDGIHGAEVVGCLERLFPHHSSLGVRPSGLGNGVHRKYPVQPISV